MNSSETLTITESAVQQFAEILGDKPGHSVRIFVRSGGCSGFQYGFAIDDTAEDDDWKFNKDGANVVVDTVSLEYLQGAVVDYKKELSGANFVISNPNAKSSCGCGSSFSCG